MAILLLTPLAMLVLDIRPNTVPGQVVESPGFDVSRLLDDNYYRSIDAWIDDRSAVKGTALRVRYEVDYGLFDDSTSSEAAIGDDGWLFMRSWVDLPCDTLDQTDRPDIPANVSDSFTWTVALGKAYWLADRLEPHDRAEPCVKRAQEELRGRLADDPSGFDLNLTIDQDPEAFFYQQDPHWNGAGRAAIAESVVERYAPGLWDATAVVDTEETLLLITDRFLGSNQERTIPDRRVERANTVEQVSEQGFGLGLLVWQHSRASGDDVIPGTTYIFGDSQMASVIPYIESYFEELIYVGWLRVALGPLPLDTLPPPDRMLIESVEQGLSTSFNNPNMLAVAERLPTN